MPQALLQQSLTRPRWRHYRRVPCSRVPRHWRAWVLSRGSLTRLLKQASSGHFRVEVLHQGWGRPTRSEAATLALPPHQRALIREVILHGQGEPWVCARSVIPATTLTGRQRQLKRLGERPLGELLFRDPSLKRSPIQIVRLQQQAGGTPVWGRRSLFYVGGKPLLVSEIFLPALRQVELSALPAQPTPS